MLSQWSANLKYSSMHKLEWKLGSVIHHVKACDAVNKVELLKVGTRTTHPLKMGSTHFV